jgi:dienelactone hydrolase
MSRTPSLHALPIAVALLVNGSEPVVRAGAVPTQAAPAKKLDARQLATIDAIAQEWFAARPRTCFDEWDDAKRKALEQRARAVGEIPENSLPDLVELLWKAAHKHAPKWKPGAHGEELPTPYGPARWMEHGEGGRKNGFALGLHGGGEGQGDMSEAAGSWNPKGCLCMFPQGIKLVHDTWNTVHGEKFALTLIEYAKWKYECDPDRVYTMGFSMGGTGSFFLAGRHPDLFAGAIPAHGVLMAEPMSQLWTKEEVKSIQHGLLPNVRNLAMYWYTGTSDDHCKPGTYLYAWDRLLELRDRDPGGYAKLTFKVWPNQNHSFPPGEPAKGIETILKERRDAFPDKVVWEYAAEPFPQPEADEATRRYVKRWYYHVHCDAPVDRMRVTVERHGNDFDVKLYGVAADSIELLLNSKLVDPQKEVTVTVDGKEVYRGRPRPDFWTVLETLDARLDRTLTFDRRVRLPSSAAGHQR